MYLLLLSNTISTSSRKTQPTRTHEVASTMHSTAVPLAQASLFSVETERMRKAARAQSLCKSTDWHPISYGDMVVYVRRAQAFS